MFYIAHGTFSYDTRDFNQTTYASQDHDMVVGCMAFAASLHVAQCSEGRMIRLEIFTNSNLSIRAFRVYPLVEVGQTVPC